MLDRSDEIKELHKELKWVSLRESNPTLTDKVMSKGISGILVSIGCAGTLGILINGVYYMFKKNSLKQQNLMRCRVLAQGITIGIALLGTFNLQKTTIQRQI